MSKTLNGRMSAITISNDESEMSGVPADGFATRNRWWCAVLLAITVLCGLGSREYAPVLPTFIVDHAGDSLWTVAAFLAICIVFPVWPPARVFVASVTLSFVVEFSQLIDGWPLDKIRQTLPGRLLLGTDFVRIDLWRYLTGGLLAFTIDWLLRRTRRSIFPDRERR